MTAAGAVYDRGYRPYEGERGGRSAARRALFAASVRRALGIRRTWLQKVLPWSLLFIVTIPAIVNVGIVYLTRDTPASEIEFFSFRDYVGVSTVLLLFVALTAPDLICPDRRYRTLSLIMSRPLTSFDYLLAKFGAVFAVVFAFGYVPQVVLFLGQMLVADGALDFLQENAEVLWQAPLSIAVLAFYVAIIGVTIASYTTRNIVASAIFVGLMLVASVTSAIVVGEDQFPRQESAGELIDLWTIPLKLRDVIFLGELANETALSGVDNGALYALGVYLAVVGICAALLAVRYRRLDA